MADDFPGITATTHRTDVNASAFHGAPVATVPGEPDANPDAERGRPRPGAMQCGAMRCSSLQLP